MGFKTKVQAIERRGSRQYYVNFPSALAQMMGLRKRETMEWILLADGTLVLWRPHRAVRHAEASQARQAKEEGRRS